LGESVDWYWFKVGFVTLLKYNVATLEENWRIAGLTKD
jgi:N-acylethanolamine-hydrolysing acid amidase